MPRKTTEELNEELKTLEKNYNQAVQVQKNCENRAIAIKAILDDRLELEQEERNRKKVTVTGILIRDCPVCGKSFKTMEQRRKYCSGACRVKFCRTKPIN